MDQAGCTGNGICDQPELSSTDLSLAILPPATACAGREEQNGRQRNSLADNMRRSLELR